jgi:hypothetical protein
MNKIGQTSITRPHRSYLLTLSALILIQVISLAGDVNFDALSFFKDAPLELVVKTTGEQLGIEIKNTSPVTLVLSKQSLLKMDVLWFIKHNGQRVTSGVRGGVISDDLGLHDHAKLAAGTTLSDIKNNKEFILINSRESTSFPIPEEALIASGVNGVANFISEKNPLDLTVALSNPIIGIIGNKGQLRAIGGQLTIFSTPVKLGCIPSLK